MSASLFGSIRATFHLVGELVGKREITKGDWQLRILKIASRGSTYEVQVERDVFERAVIDAAYEVEGDIGVDAGRTKLVAAKVGEYVPRIAQSANAARGAV